MILKLTTQRQYSYTLFHPLAYLVKLNIEMSMAQLIKTVALGNPRSNENLAAMLTLGTSSAGFRMADSSIFAEPQRPRFAILRGLSDRTLRNTIHTSSPKPIEITKTKEFDMESVAMTDVDLISPKSSEQDIHRVYNRSESMDHMPWMQRASSNNGSMGIKEPEVVDEALDDEAFVSMNFARFRFPPDKVAG